MKRINASIRTMTFEEADNAGLYSRGLMLDYEGRSYRLHAGTSDAVHVFTRSVYLFVLTVNRPLGYVGLDAYALSEEEPINSIFLHSPQHAREILGAYWNQMTPETQATRLYEYLM